MAVHFPHQGGMIPSSRTQHLARNLAQKAISMVSLWLQKGKKKIDLRVAASYSSYLPFALFLFFHKVDRVGIIRAA